MIFQLKEFFFIRLINLARFECVIFQPVVKCSNNYATGADPSSLLECDNFCSAESVKAGKKIILELIDEVAADLGPML